ncbi:MAG: hypothetical protein R3E66_13045 [bacterium]
MTTVILQLVMTVAMWMPGLTPIMPSAALEAMEQQYEGELSGRQELIGQMKALEVKHRGVVSRITQLKQAPNTLTNRLVLDDLLRQSKQLSDELAGLQSKLKTLDGKINTQRAKTVTGLEKHMKQLEASLASASPSDRAKTVNTLNALRKTRAEYEAPLPAAPSVGDLNAALTLAERAQDPDELLAAADELLDSEDQLRRRLGAIDQRLDELKQSKRLSRRASSFAREERFFEETDRDRVIARYEKTTTTSAPAKDNTAQSTDAPAEQGSANNAVSVGSMNNSNESSDGAFDYEAVANGAPAITPDPVTDARGTPTAAPAEDLFGELTQTVVINANADPSKSVEASNEGVSTSLDSQIDRLLNERRLLEKQAEALRKQAEELKLRARQQ